MPFRPGWVAAFLLAGAVAMTAHQQPSPMAPIRIVLVGDHADHAGDAVWADLSPRDDKDQVDRTHLNAKGSAVVARFVVPELRRVVPALAPYLLEQPR